MHEAVLLLCHKLQIKIAGSLRFAEHVNNMIVCGYFDGGPALYRCYVFTGYYIYTMCAVDELVGKYCI